MHEPEPIPTPQPTDAGASETEGWWPADPEEPRRERFNTRKRWAHRLAFPLMALAVVGAWRGVQVSQGEASVLPSWAWWVLAMAAALAGLVMVRERHRTPKG